MKRHIFISHSHRDRESAEKLLFALEGLGLPCWIAPRDVAAGGSYAEAILAAIKGSICLVLVYSKEANVSKHVLREVERALKFGINIIPVRFDDSTVSPSLEYLLATIHWLSALEGPPDRALRGIAEKISQSAAPQKVGLTAEEEQRLAHIQLLLNEFFRPLHVRLRRDTLSWERILGVRAPEGSSERQLAQSVERDYILPNHDEMIAIIEAQQQLIEDDHELMPLLDEYQRHIVVYKSLRAAGDLCTFPLARGAPWPQQLAPVIAKRVASLQAEMASLSARTQDVRTHASA